ncbi:hypothetical protein BEWA_033770 [Theileria equi strain WA]|uniref:Uncharacterized protein n=1 Tax=Theileria equi strain WA TaxID=1537102 RepID=L0AY63_THEEQ|nr:hypothetical protein BEWA_033770 [Theileria equi strain WA]AFZ80522.1 hypothetical protein BEWA_033770 [Theileria equi strain WA]|eukprot:XP_004830188.1 hypothetical protein BEWA_033770 [Theileria equi strain WA]
MDSNSSAGGDAYLGRIILTYGGLLCTSVAMDMPISALEGVLRKTLTSVPKLSADSVVFFGTIASALVLTFTPLYGFYVSVSATRCKMSESGYYTATLALNSLNLFLVSAMAWALLRFDDLGHLFQPKPVFNDIKMRILKNRQTPSTTQ